MGELYLYVDKSIQTATFNSTVPEWTLSSPHGYSIGRGNWNFGLNTWTRVKQIVRLNTFDSAGRPNADGKMWIFANNGLDNDFNSELSVSGVIFRNYRTMKPLGIMFDSFFGGSTSDFASSKNQFAYFKDFVLAAF